MPVHTYSHVRQGVLVARALGNDKRVVTVFLLEQRQMTESELASYHTISLQAMSRHLHILLKAGIVQSERRHGEVYFWLASSFRKDWQTFKRLLWQKRKS